MKTILTALILMASLSAHAANINLNDLSPEIFDIIGLGGDVNKIPVREEPGPDAEVIEKVVHSREVTTLIGAVKFKWTRLGYGALTHKVIIPQLAEYTLFNHRNDGEEGPCLRSDQKRFPGLKPIDAEVPDQNQYVPISIKILNKYSINREKKICKVQMVEDVRTVINGEEFYHSYTKDMGYRFIEDCPEGE